MSLLIRNLSVNGPEGKYIVVEDKLGEAFWWQVISVTPSELKLLTQYGETIILKKVISK